MDDLVGVAEIAQRLEVEVTTVHRWRERGVGFPEPIARLRAGLVWAWTDVDAWTKSTGRA